MEDCDKQKLKILIDQTEELIEIFEGLQERTKILTVNIWAIYRDIESIKKKYENSLMKLNVDQQTPRIKKRKSLSYSKEEGDISGKINMSTKE